MLYLVALILPPLALLMVGAWFQAILNFILFVLAGLLFIGTLSIASPITFPMWIICAAWALIVVYRAKDEARTRRIVSETLRNNQP
jgi:uncharacterized membrane protein YqaE (UPF0057 family)